MVPGSYLHRAGWSSPRARMLLQERPGPQSSRPKTSTVSTGEEPVCLSCGFPVGRSYGGDAGSVDPELLSNKLMRQGW